MSTSKAAFRTHLSVGSSRIRSAGFGCRVSGFDSPQIPPLPPLQNGDESWELAELDVRPGSKPAERSDTYLNRADFRTFYRDTHAVECLTDREKMLIGLTVAMMRLCDP